MDPEKFADAHSIRSEFVLAVKGKLIHRIEGTVNPNLPTGEVELEIEEFILLNRSKPVPFKLDEYSHVTEDIRLKFRYLDLRRPEMQRNMMMRSKVTSAIRSHLDAEGFLEFETPILNKSTPEGARDFLVPSRLMPGEFYALPQSPQIFKQILMVAGYDKYYQIAKCFRDEDLRANRQPEFTQIDIEMSFITPEDIYKSMEGLMRHIFKVAWDFDVVTPFQRLSYAEAMLRFGSDKPDLRFGLEIHELTEVFRTKGCEFRVFNNVLETDGAIRGFCVPRGGEMYSTTQLKPEGDLNRVVRTYGAGGMAWFRVEAPSDKAPGGLSSNITKFFKEELLVALKDELGAKEGDLILLVADRPHIAAVSLGQLRLKIARDNDLIDKSKPRFCWITDFPLFEYDERAKQYTPSHHPFTMPNIEDMDNLRKGDLGKVRAYAYDLALNGEEVGGGSIRIHDQEIQSLIFETLGIGEAEAAEKFGFLLEALQFGAPPHGGLAFGLDRLMMTLLNEESIREVIPFPKTQTGACLMSGAPSSVAPGQLEDLRLSLIEIEE
jgi:aspartyl-tRNA synthetase